MDAVSAPAASPRSDTTPESHISASVRSHTILTTPQAKAHAANPHGGAGREAGAAEPRGEVPYALPCPYVYACDATRVNLCAWVGGSPVAPPAGEGSHRDGLLTVRMPCTPPTCEEGTVEPPRTRSIQIYVMRKRRGASRPLTACVLDGLRWWSSCCLGHAHQGGNKHTTRA
jgi:hypothetical protein